MRINISDVSEKINIIKYILLWVNTVDSSTIDDEYQSILKFECESLDIGGILETFEKIDTWRVYRNEIIHGLMNKNLEALDEHIEEKVQGGMEYVKFIAQEGRKLKSKNKIRKALKLK